MRVFLIKMRKINLLKEQYRKNNIKQFVSPICVLTIGRHPISQNYLEVDIIPNMSARKFERD